MTAMRLQFPTASLFVRVGKGARVKSIGRRLAAFQLCHLGA